MIAKRTLSSLHRRVAVIAALFLLVQAASGMAISWRWEAARFFDPSGMTGTRGAADADADPEQVLGRAVANLPAASTTRIFFPGDARGVYFLQLDTEQGTHYASINPADGSVLRQGSVWRFPVEAALQLHFQPLPGWPGNLLVLALALALVSLGVTGFLFWLPGQDRGRGRLAIDTRQPAKRVVRQLHRTLGIIALPLLLTIAITGALLTVEILLAASGPSAEKKHYKISTFAGFSRALEAAQQAFPGTQVRDVRISQSGAVRFQFHKPDKDPWEINRVTTSLQAPSVIEPQPASELQAWWPQLLPIHTGSLLGIPGRLLATATAGILGLLTIIGAYMWLDRARQRRS